MNAESVAHEIATGNWEHIKGAPRERNGWVDDPFELDETIERALALKDSLSLPPILAGMGGSSSTAAMVSHLAGVSLPVLDSSHPDTVDSFSPTESTYIVSSKSGGTIETTCALADALARGLDPRNVVVITDPGSGLEQLAQSLGATIFSGNPRTGGRFSATSAFGVVPAILAGANPEVVRAARPSSEDWEQWFLQGVADAQHRTYELPGDPLSNFFALWEEQLVAESTGKEGRGLFPIAGHAPAVANFTDVISRHMRIVGQCWALGVDPFNQPDVEGAKVNSLAFLSNDAPTPEFGELESFVESLSSAGAVAIEVFGPTTCAPEVAVLRDVVRQRTTAPVVAGIGPRFLHSTGQLLKGGPQPIVHLQVRVAAHVEPRRISGRNYSFHDLIRAQANGDLVAIRSTGAHAVVVEVANSAAVATLLN